ncbi:MAG: PAS domain-containing protein, partial [Candidatus Krumholzibacteria bacterium]|nr:PAS domain-containing protein [Candidatus Krumholzibacteria bacterium]
MRFGSTEEPVGLGKSWSPPWVDNLGVPVWISDPDGNLSYVNSRAESLLGRPAAACIGLPCYSIVCGYDDLGRPFCGSLCPIRSRANLDKEIEPVRLRVVGSGKTNRWIQVMPITTQSPDGSGPHVVHCVLDEDKLHRIEEYLTRVANRSNRRDDDSFEERFALTRREREILRLLAEDETL